MNNRSRDPHRRVLDEFGAADEIVGVDIDYSLDDLKLFVPAMFLALIIVSLGSRILGPWATTVSLVGAVGVFLVTGVVVYIAPAHMTPHRWLKRIALFATRENTRSAVDTAPEDRPDTLTQVARFVPQADAVERQDGHLVAAVRVDPANMALATHDEWDTAANALGNALNTLEFPIQIHVSARSVDPERITESYRERRDDPDVQANDALREIVEAYETRLPAEFRARGTSLREYHILVPVSIRDVQLAERGAVSQLQSLPYIGGLLAFVGAESSGLSDAEIEQHQRETLEHRLDDVQAAIRGLDACDCEPVSADRLAALIEEFWTGRRTQYRSTTDRVRSVPIVTVGDANQRA